MNVILICLDTLRADRLGCYGHFRRTSPHIDAVAAQGAIFAEHFSPHIPTYPGHTTMLTGRDVYAHHVTGQSGAFEPTPGIPMLAERFSANGYYTAAADNLGRWFARGFQHCEGYGWDTTAPADWRKGEAVNAAALRVLNEAADQDRPFFLFLHYWDPHTPYLPPAPFSRMFYEGDERDPTNRSMAPVWAFENFKWYFHEWMPGVTDIEFPKAQYDAEIAYMDACLAHVFQRIEELDLVDNTLLALTSDHGEELDEHGCWFDHHGLYDPNTHIPLIMRMPAVIEPRTRVAGLTRMTDLTPTILDYAGLLDPTEKFDGATMRPLLEYPAASVARGTCDAIHMTENTWMKKRAVRTHQWKLIRALEPDIHDFPAVELYRLSDDPHEQRNLAAELPDVVSELQALMDGHVSKRVAETGLPDPIPVQPLPLKRVGKMAESDPARAVPEERASASDEKLADGDFIGYDRED